jgi:hypothetical protein
MFRTKTRLNIQEIAMPVSAAPAAGAATAAAVEDEPAAEVVRYCTHMPQTVYLTLV